MIVDAHNSLQKVIKSKIEVKGCTSNILTIDPKFDAVKLVEQTKTSPTKSFAVPSFSESIFGCVFDEIKLTGKDADNQKVKLISNEIVYASSFL